MCLSSFCPSVSLSFFPSCLVSFFLSRLVPAVLFLAYMCTKNSCHVFLGHDFGLIAHVGVTVPLPAVMSTSLMREYVPPALQTNHLFCSNGFLVASLFQLGMTLLSTILVLSLDHARRADTQLCTEVVRKASKELLGRLVAMSFTSLSSAPAWLKKKELPVKASVLTALFVEVMQRSGHDSDRGLGEEPVGTLLAVARSSTPTSIISALDLSLDDLLLTAGAEGGRVRRDGDVALGARRLWLGTECFKFSVSRAIAIGLQASGDGLSSSSSHPSPLTNFSEILHLLFQSRGWREWAWSSSWPPEAPGSAGSDVAKVGEAHARLISSALAQVAGDLGRRVGPFSSSQLLPLSSLFRVVEVLLLHAEEAAELVGEEAREDEVACLSSVYGDVIPALWQCLSLASMLDDRWVRRRLTLCFHLVS